MISACVVGVPDDGTVLLNIIGKPVHKLEGEYWTQRHTTGTVTLTFRTKELLDEIPNDFPEHPISGRKKRVDDGNS